METGVHITEVLKYKYL